jgi:hypothetical protein
LSPAISFAVAIASSTLPPKVVRGNRSAASSGGGRWVRTTTGALAGVGPAAGGHPGSAGGATGGDRRLASVAGVVAALGPARRAAELDILDAIAST